MKVALVQSVSGLWGYCPENALSMIGEKLHQADEGSQTMGAALELATKEFKGAQFRVIPCMPKSCP